MRFVFRVPQALDRRLFLRTMLFGAMGLMAWRTSNLSKRLLALPGANRRFTGSYEWGQMGEYFPAVSWIFDNPPPIVSDEWQLRLDGAVATAVTFTYAQLRQMAAEQRIATLDCTGGWYT